MNKGWLAAMLCLSLSPVAAQRPTFTADRESVRLDVLVTDRGRPVRDLKAADFAVFDSGVPQQVDFVSFEQLPLNVVLALDTSSSIAPERLAHLRDGGLAVLGNLKRDDQSSLVTFADLVTLRERLTPDANRVRLALEQMAAPPGAVRGTALIDACYTAMTVLGSDPGRGLLIAFTDGVDTSSWLSHERVLQVARRSNLVAYAVSTSPLRKSSFLRDLVDATGGSVFEIASTGALQATFVRILDEFRERYLVSFSPADVAPGGWHPVTVRVKTRTVDVKARPGYTR